MYVLVVKPVVGDAFAHVMPSRRVTDTVCNEVLDNVEWVAWRLHDDLAWCMGSHDAWKHIAALPEHARIELE
jgi:hypothetical protein